MLYVSVDSLTDLLDALTGSYDVYVPVKEQDQRFYKQYPVAPEEMVVGEVRPFEPLKAFFFRARERVATGFSSDVPGASAKPACIVGVKACDLKGFKTQDFVFQNHDYADPFYKKAREEALIISADCTCAIDTCFCRAVDVEPYPRADFDLNLSAVNEGFVVEVGSEKGQAVVDKYATLFEQATAEHIDARDAQRAAVAQQVDTNIADNAVPAQERYDGAVERNFEAAVWRDEAETCVECGACNTVCPTCHCFFLFDQKDETGMARFRLWDSCMIKDFARVAGGANPRPELWMRLRNRFEKKFDYFPKVAGLYACTGCGRCISACPAKIDIREVLKKLVAHV